MREKTNILNIINKQKTYIVINKHKHIKIK